MQVGHYGRVVAGGTLFNMAIVNSIDHHDVYEKVFTSYETHYGLRVSKQTPCMEAEKLKRVMLRFGDAVVEDRPLR